MQQEAVRIQFADLARRRNYRSSSDPLAKGRSSVQAKSVQVRPNWTSRQLSAFNRQTRSRISTRPIVLDRIQMHSFSTSADAAEAANCLAALIISITI
jgi:hypothetical protein